MQHIAIRSFGDIDIFIPLRAGISGVLESPSLVRGRPALFELLQYVLLVEVLILCGSGKVFNKMTLTLYVFVVFEKPAILAHAPSLLHFR